MEDKRQTEGIYTAVLGTADKYAEYEIHTADCGIQSGIKYSSISIDPKHEEDENMEDKEVTITCIDTKQINKGLQYSTIIIEEVGEDEKTGRNDNDIGVKETESDDRKVKVINCLKLAPPSEMQEQAKSSEQQLKLKESQTRHKSNNNEPSEESGMFVSDPDELQFIHSAPPQISRLQKQQSETNKEDEVSEESGIFTSDPDALKFIRFAHQNSQQQNQTNKEDEVSEESGIFASDPDALKFIHFAPPRNSQQQNQTNKEDEVSEESGMFSVDTGYSYKFGDFKVWRSQQEALSCKSKTDRKQSNNDRSLENEVFSVVQKEISTRLTNNAKGAKKQELMTAACNPQVDSNRKNEIFPKKGDITKETAKCNLHGDEELTVEVETKNQRNGLKKKIISVSGRHSTTNSNDLETSVTSTINENGQVEKIVSVTKKTLDQY